MLRMANGFYLEFRRFLDDSKICYSSEDDSLFFITENRIYVKLVSFDEYFTVHYTPEVSDRYIFLHQDRWISRGHIVKSIISSLAGNNRVVFARNSTIEKIDRSNAMVFHANHHLIGAASARHNYALKDISNGSILAISSFSSPRTMLRDGLSVKSYEWVRYTSATGVRVVGGMSKMLSHFIHEHAPEEIMTYCDADWSDGRSYANMGLLLHSKTDTIDYLVNKSTSERVSIKKIRRDMFPTSPDYSIESCYLLRTQGNLKFLGRF